MKLTIQENRKITPIVAQMGIQNKNKITELTFEIPEECQDWNKRIVFLTSENNF